MGLSSIAAGVVNRNSRVARLRREVLRNTREKQEAHPLRWVGFFVNEWISGRVPTYSRIVFVSAISWAIASSLS